MGSERLEADRDVQAGCRRTAVGGCGFCEGYVQGRDYQERRLRVRRVATLAPSDVKGLSTNKLIALIKEKLVKTAEVNGSSVVNDSNFHVMLGTQLTDIQNGKPGTYQIGFMYDGNGYNNEQVGSATLVIAQPSKPGTTTPGTTTPNTGDKTEKGDKANSDKNGSAKKANVKSSGNKTSQKSGKDLPKTGDADLGIAGTISAAGASLAALGIFTKRREHQR